MQHRYRLRVNTWASRRQTRCSLEFSGRGRGTETRCIVPPLFIFLSAMNATTSLQAAPTELLMKIFTHACSDTGYTGYTLNLVCKAFREICLDTALDI